MKKVKKGDKGRKGDKGKKGQKGKKGDKGNTINWWDTFTYTFDSTIGGAPSSGNVRIATNNYVDTTGAPASPFVIDGVTNSYSMINLEQLVTANVLKKQYDTPSVGYTTYTQLTNILIDISDNTTYDPFVYNYFALLEGYHYDGNGFSIDISNNIESLASPQNGFKGLFNVMMYDHRTEIAYLKKGNLIKNLEIKGTVAVDAYNGAFVQYPNTTEILGSSSTNRLHNSINVTIQNCICRRTRLRAGVASTTSATGYLPTVVIVPGYNGYLLVENCCTIYEHSDRPPIPLGIAGPNLGRGDTGGQPNTCIIRNCFVDASGATLNSPGTNSAHSATDNSTYAGYISTSIGYPSGNNVIIENCYAIDENGDIVTEAANKLMGNYNNTSNARKNNFVEHDGTSLIQGFQALPFQGYTSLTSTPTLLQAYSSVMTSAKKLTIHYNDSDSKNIKTFLTNLNYSNANIKLTFIYKMM